MAVVHSDGEAAFVEQAVVPAAEEHEVRELRFAAIGPVDDVMRVAVPGTTAREAATPVAELQGAPDGWRYGPRLAADAQYPPRTLAHLDLPASQAMRRAVSALTGPWESPSQRPWTTFPRERPASLRSHPSPCVPRLPTPDR